MKPTKNLICQREFDMKRMSVRLAIIVLSMPLVAATVKAQGKAESPSNPASDHRESKPKDSVNREQREISKLIDTLLASGDDGSYANGLAQAIGLDRPMRRKTVMVPIDREARKCHIVYEQDETAGNRPFCVYILRAKKTQHDVEERFYRVSLDGRLEKVITLRNKLDDKGIALREGRSRVEEDMTSPDIKKAFKTEMSFWLKDWLKKQPKLDTKSTVPNAATPAQATP
jgi:hypothetical protein